MAILENSLKKALRKGQTNTKQHAAALESQLKNFESEVVDRLNWLMKNQQKLMDHLKIKVEDPLEE